MEPLITSNIQATHMKAAVYYSYGTPEELHLTEIERPSPEAGELLVKVHTTSVNRTDCAMLTADPFIMRIFTGLFKPRNPILGTEFTGEVIGIGEGVSRFKVGDRIFGFEDIGLNTYAQYLTINEDKPLATLPQDMSFEEVAGGIEGAHYAYNFINKVEVKEGTKVLVNGATGAIGSAAVQLLKNMGAYVTAVCNTKNITLIKSLGVDRIIDYQTEDFTKDEEQYDFVFDAVGKSSFGACKPLLKPKGVYISSELGYMAQNLFYSLSTPAFGGKKVVFPIPLNPQTSIDYIKKLLEEGAYRVIVDRTYPLSEISEAFTYVHAGKKTGNVQIAVA